MTGSASAGHRNQHNIIDSAPTLCNSAFKTMIAYSPKLSAAGSVKISFWTPADLSP